MTRVKSLVQPDSGFRHRVHRKKRKIYTSPDARDQRIIKKQKLEKLRLEQII